MTVNASQKSIQNESKTFTIKSNILKILGETYVTDLELKKMQKRSVTNSKSTENNLLNEQMTLHKIKMFLHS